MARTIITDCDCFLPPVASSAHGRVVSATDIFGPATSATAPPDTAPVFLPAEGIAPWQTPAFEGTVVGICLLTLYLVHRYGSSIVQVFRVFSGQLSAEKAYTEQTLFFRQFLSLSALWAALLGGGLLVRLSGTFLPEDAVAWKDFSPTAVNLAVLAVPVIAGIVALYRRFVTRAAAALTRQQDFFSEYRFGGRLFLALGCCLLTPPFLVIALTRERWAEGLCYGIAGIVAALAAVYLAKSYRFFVGRNVSILRWILYLCAVEIFPISFFVLALTRNS